MDLCVSMHAWVPLRPEEVVPLELELQTVVRCQWVLGAEPRSTATTSALNLSINKIFSERMII